MTQSFTQLARYALIFGAAFLFNGQSKASNSPLTPRATLYGFIPGQNWQAEEPTGLQIAEMSIGKAAKKIRQRTGGKILQSKKKTKNGRTVYKIKVLLPNGKVKIFTVDPNQG